MLPPAAGRSSSDAPRCCGQPSRPATRPEAQVDWAQHPEPRIYLYCPRAQPPGLPKAPNPSGPRWRGGGSPEPGVLSATSDERLYLRSAARAGQQGLQAATATLFHLVTPCFNLVSARNVRAPAHRASQTPARLIGHDQVSGTTPPPVLSGHLVVAHSTVSPRKAATSIASAPTYFFSATEKAGLQIQTLRYVQYQRTAVYL